MRKDGRQGITFSLRLKITVTFLIVGALVSGSLSITMYQILSRRLFEELQVRLLSTVTIGSGLVDAGALQRLVGKLGADLPDDKVAAVETSADYRSVSNVLNRIRSVEPRLIRYVYLFRPTADPNQATYLVDADVLDADRRVAAGEKDVGDISHFASAFDVSTFPMARRAETQAVPLTETTYSYDPDFKVNSLSGYAPVFARDGHTLLGVLGIDMVDTDVRAVLQGALRVALAVIAAALLLTVLSSIFLGTLFTRGIASLDKVVRRFSKDNLDVRAEVRSRDEVGRLGQSFNVMADTVKDYSLQLEGLLTAYGRFVPRDFLVQLGKGSIVDVKLGDQVQREMTVLFSDIRSFTSLSETMTPAQNFSFLNSYLGRMGPEIRANGGFIDKYIGDAIMALFSEGPEKALRAALAIQGKLVEYNGHRAKTGYTPIQVGIGVHCGSLMLGTLGEHERMDGSVISDAVNLASRLEGLTRMYGASILTTGQTVSKLADPHAFDLRFIDRVRVKGRKETVMLFEVLDGTDERAMERKLAYQAELSAALRSYYAREFKDSLSVFSSLRRRNPEDPVLAIFEKRSRMLSELGAPTDWDGVVVLETKSAPAAARPALDHSPSPAYPTAHGPDRLRRLPTSRSRPRPGPARRSPLAARQCRGGLEDDPGRQHRQCRGAGSGGRSPRDDPAGPQVRAHRHPAGRADPEVWPGHRLCLGGDPRGGLGPRPQLLGRPLYARLRFRQRDSRADAADGEPLLPRVPAP